jgi:hypothetical protein
MRIYTFLALFILLVVSSAFAQEQAIDNGNGFGGLIENTDGVVINWADGFIAASAEIKLMPGSIDPIRSKALAVRQGGVESRKALLDVILGLPLDGKRKVAALLEDDPKSMNSLRGYVQNSLLNTEMTNGTVKVSASLNLRNGLSSILIPPTLSFQTGIPPTLSGKRGEIGVERQALEGGGSGLENGSVYSGVIVDARGLSCHPVLLPLIYDGKGIGVYGAFAVSREAVLKRGLVSYMVNDKSENLRARVGNFPLIIKAVNTNGPSRSNFILSIDDAAKVRAVLKRKTVMDNCAVAVLMDKHFSAATNNDSAKSDVNDQKQEIPAVINESVIQENSLDENAAPSTSSADE